MAGPVVLHHFSEDPTITRFVPHVPATNPDHRPAVWAIDADHAPLYWFPRDCPRVTVWPRSAGGRTHFTSWFLTSADRLHAIETGWLSRMRDVVLYRYDLPAAPFSPWAEARGQWIAEDEVVPLRVEPVGDLLALHAGAEIELRLMPDLWPLIDAVVDGAATGDWDFSVVRKHLARPRRGG